MRVLVVYCHPSQNSFTYEMTASFILGLKKAGHEVIFNDLYKINFQSDMSEAEYMREGFYDEHLALSQMLLINKNSLTKVMPLYLLIQYFGVKHQVNL